AEQRILEVTRVRRTTEMQRSREVVNEVMENLNRIRDNHDRITSFTTSRLRCISVVRRTRVTSKILCSASSSSAVSSVVESKP
ncbi:hypothetical protein PT069_09385, partial [Erysipelothrix rhusiopathiae]|nr:hypothetical protein [Erysipelothrix rhusiopathiae]